MKEGDIILGYFSGIFKVTKVTARPNIAPLISMVKVFNSKFEPVHSKKEYSCDAGYCVHIEEYLENELLALEKRKKKLLDFKRENL
jgi:hypothetical protein